MILPRGINNRKLPLSLSLSFSSFPNFRRTWINPDIAGGVKSRRESPRRRFPRYGFLLEEGITKIKSTRPRQRATRSSRELFNSHLRWETLGAREPESLKTRQQISRNTWRYVSSWRAWASGLCKFSGNVKRAPLSLRFFFPLARNEVFESAEPGLAALMVRMRSETTTNGPSRAEILPGRSCDTQVARAARGARSSSLEWPRRARRHLVYPTASSWPEYPAAAKKRPGTWGKGRNVKQETQAGRSFTIRWPNRDQTRATSHPHLVWSLGWGRWSHQSRWSRKPRLVIAIIANPERFCARSCEGCKKI